MPPGSGKKRIAFWTVLRPEKMGTLYPFIQGAMSWITDIPEFAVKVSDAGGLPTFALGLMGRGGA